ncbi:MAG: exodeoxyribonuclease III [Vicinamibacterales bacterium]
MLIATWNVNGIRARVGQLLDWTRAERPDVVCLQEIKAAPDQIPNALKYDDDYWTYWHGGKGYSGVALLVRKAWAPVVPTFEHPAFDMETRIVTTRLTAASDREGGRTRSMLVASVYVPNGGKDYEAKLRFFRDLVAFAAHARDLGHDLVVCGDLNIAHREIDVHPKERKALGIGQRTEERQLFDDLLATGLVDLCRHHDPENDGLFTWWPPWRNMRQRNIGWRIDYLLASSGLLPAFDTSTVHATVGTSDHAPVAIRLALRQTAQS